MYALPPAPRGADTRAWHQKKRVLLPLGGVLFIGFIVALSVGNPGGGTAPVTADASSASPTPVAESEPTADELAALEAEEQAAEEAQAAAEAEAEAAAAAEAEAAATEAAEAARAAAFGEQPADQAQFVQAVVAAQDAARNADNDLQKGAAKAERDTALCSLLVSKDVAGWTGKLIDIDANGEGKGILTVEVAEDVEIGTWNNFLSDFQDDTLVEATSPVFQNALDLEEGQLVRFSGTLIADGAEGGCLRESRLTLDGGLTSPSFIFRFSELSGI